MRLHLAIPLVAILLHIVLFPQPVAASCVVTATDESNVYVVNNCNFPIIARVRDKHKIDRGVTDIIAPGKRELLEDFGISDGMSVKSWCDVGKHPHCRPP